MSEYPKALPDKVARFSGPIDGQPQTLHKVDYVAIEKRVIANMGVSKDIHIETAAEIYGVEEKDVTPEQRRAAKVINFGAMYGKR